MSPERWVAMAMGLCLLGAGFAWICSSRRALSGWVSFVFVAGSGGIVLYAAYLALSYETAPPYMGLFVDGLSAFFLALIGTVAILASLYSIRYMSHYSQYGVARYYPPFLLFVAGMYGIVTTTDLFLFFCGFWQLMTIPSYFLIRYEYRERKNIRAANKYLLLMEISCGLVMLGGLCLPKGSLWVHVAMALFFVGFGIKAGMWPFGQIWLPDAHPAAPSPVSALLSGVMIKTGIYGLIRSFLWLAPAEATFEFPLSEWGFVLCMFGTLTLFVGTLQALKQEQSKRMLAFSSIGQVGYIILGIGACVALLGSGPAAATLAAMAFYATLFHLFNHGIFKSLLFLNAGSIFYVTGTQDLRRLGGLMRVMPWTALTALVASFSIAGAPLFNGFSSKWTLYVATILGSHHVAYLLICGIFGILTSAITLAVFMTFFGVSFLSRESDLVRDKLVNRKSLEVPWTMLAPKLFLAGACMALGLIPAWAYRVIERVLTHDAQGFSARLVSAAPATWSSSSITPLGEGAIWSPLVVLGAVLCLMLLARGIARGAGSPRRKTESWLCGYSRDADIHRYGAHHLYGEVKRYLGWVGGEK